MNSKHKVTEGLKKFSNVNKKALEQYKNFTDNRESLTARKDDLDRSAKAIQDLIEVLDQKKDEASSVPSSRSRRISPKCSSSWCPRGRHP